MNFSVVLFGAGASRDQAANGQPPLMPELFACLAAIYPEWRAEQARFEARDFESAMDQLLRSDETFQSETWKSEPSRKYLMLKLPSDPLPVNNASVGAG